MADLKIRAVLFQEEGWWVAQCLDYDIAAQARTQADLLYELERILIGYLVISSEKGLRPFERLPQAPRRYWVMYEQADPIPSPEPSLWQGPFEDLPDIELRAA
jgi:hypothetical protein